MLILYIAVAVLGSSAMSLVGRHVLKESSAHAFTLLTNGIAALLFIPIALTDFRLTDSAKGWFVLLVATALWSLSSLLGSISQKTTHASIRAPLGQSKLLWAMLFGAVILHEAITWQHIIAVFIIFAGISLLLWHPEYKFGSLRDPGIRWTLGSALLGAIVAVVDKYTLNFFPPATYGLFAFLVPSLILLLFTPKRGEDVKHLLRVHRPAVIWFSLLMVATYYAYLQTYLRLPISVAYPLLQLSTLVTVIGGIFILKEREHLSQKIIAAGLVILGSVLLKLT